MPATPARRVVTGINAQGKSYFVHDGPTPGHLDLGLAIDDEIWVDDPANPDTAAEQDPARAEKFYLEPPQDGSIIRVFTFFPEGQVPPSGEDFAKQIAEAGARFDTRGVMEEENPGMHTTKTIDYGIVLSGKIILELDEGEVELEAGDIVVQRATRHGWHNRGSEPCKIAFILIGSSNYR